MKYRPLGKTGLIVSEIGFGAWGIGGRTVGTTSYGDTDDAMSLAALRRARECGISFFDTSAAYGNGHSEELIGQAFEGSRTSIVIATKAGYDSWDRPPDFSPTAITASAEASLRRLRTDYIDLLQLHNASQEVLEAAPVRAALARLIEVGKVRAWGVSSKSPGEALAALRVVDVAVVQANFNMMDVRAASSSLFEEVGRRQAASSGAHRFVLAFCRARSAATPCFRPATTGWGGRGHSSTTGSTAPLNFWRRLRHVQVPRALKRRCASASRSRAWPARFRAS